MITGDKQETAINIATSCKLISSLERLLLCNAPFSTEAAHAKLIELSSAMEEPEALQFQAGQPPQVLASLERPGSHCLGGAALDTDSAFQLDSLPSRESESLCYQTSFSDFSGRRAVS